MSRREDNVAAPVLEVRSNSQSPNGASETHSYRQFHGEATQTYKQLLEKQDSLQRTIEQQISRERQLQDQVETGNLKEFVKLLERASSAPDEVATGDRYLSEIKSGQTVGNDHRSEV